MHDHRETLDLAAVSIDFELDPAERAHLEAGLETCSLCRRQASAMRATATILHRPSDIGTPDRVRDVVLGAALGRSRRTPRFGSVLAASLSILVLLGGTVLIVGNRGFGILPPTPTGSPPAPVPTASAVAVASPPSTPSPAPTPSPINAASPSAPSPDPNAPLHAGDVATMVTDGRMVIRTLPQASADSAIFKTRLYPGQRVQILEGPVEGSGYPWFRIRLGVIEGWVAAAGLDGEPWLARVSNGVIAFVRDAAIGSEAIYTIGPDGTADEKLLLADPAIAHYEQLSWSPDGTRLAFVGLPLTPDIDPGPEIFVIDADGSNLVQVTQNDLFEDSPAWSPDSSRLAFRQALPNPVTDPTVVVANPDGSDLRVLGPGENPAWSPDGQQIAMTVPGGDSTGVWVQSADGSDRRQVGDISVASVPPVWSPDGQFIVVASSGLLMVELSTGSITSLTVEPASTLAWSIRGMIAFSTAGSDSPGTFVMNGDSSGLRRLAGDLGAATVQQWAPDGAWLLLGSKTLDSPIVVVDSEGARLTYVGGGTYVVATGDTFARIAAAHALTVDQLLAANPQINDPNRVEIGNTIVIPTFSGSVGAPAWQPRLP